jgi:universal stress protein E
MKRLLVVADPYGSPLRIIARAIALASRLQARLDVVGFVYEHLRNLPIRLDEADLRRFQEDLVEKHRREILEKLSQTAREVEINIEVHWEKRVADWVIRRVEERHYDLVVKTGHRSETFLYTSTDWQLLRRCRVPVLLLADKRWRRGAQVLAAVDLGTRVKRKVALNYEIVGAAASMATALGCQLHIGYAVPFSKVLRDLDVLDKAQLRRQGKRLAQAFQRSIADRGVTVKAMHVVMGAPEKALVSLAAKNGIGLIVVGCVGRARLAGRVIGNTAEQILRLVKADVLAIKP